MAKKVKYYFDTESLAYRKIKSKPYKKAAYFGLFIVASALFGFICFVALLNSSYLDTPKDRLQTRELETMKLQYVLLNKKAENNPKKSALEKDFLNALQKGKLLIK